MSEPWWEKLFSLCRPGSRTVVCDPPDNLLVVELARRGYRILVLHDGQFSVAALRTELRQAGLSSQLMGSQTYGSKETPALAASFYELWIFCAAPTEPLLQAAALTLKKGSAAFWRSSGAMDFTSLCAKALAAEPISKLPDGLAGVRT